MKGRLRLVYSSLDTGLRIAGQGLRILFQEMLRLLKPDILSGIIVCIFLALFLSTVGRHSADAPLLAAFEDDEPLITMQLDGMTAWPYGNPANYLYSTHQIPTNIPHYWHTPYVNLPYYGGLFLDLGFVVWMPLKLLGVPMFPAAPIILRALTLFFSSCTILAAYNTGRILFGRWSALASGLFLLTNYNFELIATFIHPDSLLFFLMFVALAVAIRHTRSRTLASALSLGIVAGLAQGAKVGGPLLVPLTVAAIVIGAYGSPGWVKTIAARGGLAALVAVIVFFITTPYALVNDYYFYTWGALAKACAGASPIQNTTFLDWTSAFIKAVTMPVIVATVAAAGLRLATLRRYENNVAVLLYAVLGATIFFWYAGLQRFWIQPQYLVVAFCLMAALAGGLVDQMVGFLPADRRTQMQVGLAGMAVVLIGLTLKPLMRAAVTQALYYADWKEDPRYALGQWADANVKHGSRMLSDLPGYFSEASFPDQSMNNAPVRYIDLVRLGPDYFVETIYHNKMWMGEKMAAAPLDKWDITTYPSLRLYQDILGRDHTHPVFHAGAVPGVELVASMGHDGTIPIGCDNDQFVLWKVLRNWLGTACNPAMSQSDLTLFLFRLNKPEFMAQVPEAILNSR